MACSAVLVKPPPDGASRGDGAGSICGWAATDWNGSTAMPSPAAMASANSSAPAAANPPAAEVAQESPTLFKVAMAEAKTTSESTSALGAATRAACAPDLPR